MPKKANIFDSFSHSAIQQFKEAFGIMDTDKDGLLSASDLVVSERREEEGGGVGLAQ
jgi:Ca2+-binding EF-hand superfamily protein